MEDNDLNDFLRFPGLFISLVLLPFGFNHAFNNILTNIIAPDLIWINLVYSGKERSETR